MISDKVSLHDLSRAVLRCFGDPHNHVILGIMEVDDLNVENDGGRTWDVLAWRSDQQFRAPLLAACEHAHAHAQTRTHARTFVDSFSIAQ